MEFTAVVQKRISSRSFLDKPVEEKKIDYILDCARLAPSWANKQCWKFIVINEKKTIEHIAKTTIVNRWLKTAPTLIVACGDTSQSTETNDINYYLVDVAIAMEHLILAATNVDLGTCWIVGFDETKVKELLGIPKRIKVIALTPVGYPAEKETIVGKTTKVLTRPTKRKSLLEIVKYEKW
jgi:nitroreductase